MDHRIPCVRFTCYSKGKQNGAGSLCGTAMCSVLPKQNGGWVFVWNSNLQCLAMASRVLYDHDRIAHNMNRVVMRRKDPFLVNFSSLVCFHQHFQFMIQRTLQLAIFGQYNYDTSEAVTVCIPNVYETASLKKAGHWQCSIACL